MSSQKAFRREDLMEEVITILREQPKQPLHYKDIVDELMRRGFAVEDQQKAYERVRGYLSNDIRLVRPTSRGFYALREDFPTARNIGTRKRVRR
ncbi:MAG: HTH domain-containing protein [Anaerolineaceae bacterium]|nr:HTH domain-containing protein [Anaerolineaceae bacterium]